MAKRIADEPAFVLHRYDWSESSLILEVFTRHHGRTALAAKGVKRPSSNFRPVLLPLQMLSGGTTPRESMPEGVQLVMMAAPTTHYVMLAQSILYRGAGLSVVWPQFLWLAGIGAALFDFALARFRSTVGKMA